MNKIGGNRGIEFDRSPSLCIVQSYIQKCCMMLSQPRPQGLLLIQKGVRRNPWLRLQSRIVDYFVTRSHILKWLFRRLFPASGGPVCFCNLKPLFKGKISLCLRDKILTNVWSHFGSLGQGFLQSAILNEEKALGTMLLLSPLVRVLTFTLRFKFTGMKVSQFRKIQHEPFTPLSDEVFELFPGEPAEIERAEDLEKQLLP